VDDKNTSLVGALKFGDHTPRVRGKSINLKSELQWVVDGREKSVGTFSDRGDTVNTVPAN